MSGVARVRKPGRGLAAGGRAQRSARGGRRSARCGCRCCGATNVSMRNGTWPASVPGQPRRCVLRELQGDLGAGVADADDEDGAVRELRRVAVFERVELTNRRIEIRGERRDLRLLEVRHRDHDVVRLEGLLPCGHHEPFTVARRGRRRACSCGRAGRIAPCRPRDSPPSRPSWVRGYPAWGIASRAARSSGRG